MFNTDRHRILRCNLGVKDISDHAGVYLSIHLETEIKQTSWKLNTSLLNDTRCIQFVRKEYNNYCELNDNQEVSPSITWDASKAVMRGKLIMWSSYKKKEKQMQINKLLLILKNLETKHATVKDPQTLEEINSVKRRLNDIYDRQEEIKARFVKQKYYDYGPRAKKLLAWRIRKQEEERGIYSIKDEVSRKACVYYRHLFKFLGHLESEEFS